jgi:hypothetical protein
MVYSADPVRADTEAFTPGALLFPVPCRFLLHVLPTIDSLFRLSAAGS